MFSQEVRRAIAEAAVERGMEPAALLALAEVESGGAAFARVDGRDEPVIRFEGHYFDRRLSGQRQQEARAAGLASPVAGRVRNPASQAARWALLRRAAVLDAGAAYESTSWGLGQVMGAHWAWLGFDSVEALVAEARGGAAGQARLMARYIEKAGLSAALRARDWAGFARGYNGPGFRAGGYDRKLAAAYARQAGTAAPGMSAPPAVLRRRDRGEAVADLQRLLAASGYPTAADGVFGPATGRAVVAFQTAHGLAPDGIAGPKTLAALRAAEGLAASGLWGRLLAFLAGLAGRLALRRA